MSQTTTPRPPAELDLSARYRPGAGPVPVTGVQAIARLLVEQHAADGAAGLNTATFVSGYQGSPLAGLDMTLAKASELTETAALKLVPAVNEELAATSVWGSQLEVPGHARTVDGAVGIWYGKAPGVDRSGDALRHANISGAHPHGGVLVLAGDDPGCKSSTIPCTSEQTLASYGLPVLYPADAADIVRLGRYGVALSRASGMWVGMKITTDVADGIYTVDGSVGEVEVTVPELEWEGKPWTYRQYPSLTPPASLRAEEQLHGPRAAMVRAFLAANPINTVEVDTPDAWLGIIAGGKTYADVRQTLRDVGLDEGDGETALRRAGIRLLRLGMIHPLERDEVRAFAAGLETVLVVEEKEPFIERAVRDVLYGMSAAPVVIGAADAEGRPLVPVTGDLNARSLEGPLRRVLRGRVDLAPSRREPPVLELLSTGRTPYFCSGCPHSRSTLVPDGSVAAGGIGCHGMVTLDGRPETDVVSLTQMGGEGAQWIGQAAFTTARHLYQNMGDGTFAHSGQLAVQACVSAGVSITFKLLYNKAVALTGGQDAAGGLEVPAIAAKLLAEGVNKIIICADEPERYRRLPKLPAGVALWQRDRFDEAQKVLAEVKGVSVLIYDQQCAAEARRLRKRGAQPVRRTRVVINEAVCEGCGDCGVKSNCLSVQPVDTEFGRKTHIDQSSCNTDYSCLDGDCPSFMTIELPPGTPSKRSAPQRPEPTAVAEPNRTAPHGMSDVFLAGIGGTGIVTVNQVLATAAIRDGLTVNGLDQTGLSQKAGPVVSHLRIAHRDSVLEPANRVGGEVACYLAFDALVGADAKNLAFASLERTVAVVSTSAVPTGAQVRDASLTPPDADELLSRFIRRTKDVLPLDTTAAAQALFGDGMPANFLLVGAAYQAGVLPMSAAAIEWAIEANGVAVKNNIAAFRWGRVAVADATAFAAAVSSDRPASTLKAPADIDLGDLTGETRRLAGIRATQLIGYQSKSVAQRYVTDMLTVWRAERAVGQDTAFSEAVARGLYKLTAYKDEYEVARLLTDPAFEAQLQAEVPGGVKPRYRLHPPILKAMGREKKIAFGPWMRPVLRMLAKGRVLRDTPFDPFGHLPVRKLERQLRDSYRTTVLRLANELTEESYSTAAAAAEAADMVRGYEDIKLANVDRYRARLAELGLS
ncbi:MULTISPECIES: indolepyruvate ferredoxin oxidoreductase family protein [Streptomyces]|uniref:indolepyruvate ferredoxin oxidoreductase family protein n=1 Tax=Streptomyces TaxID=1883 RepID=UPI00187F22A8|nr:indolepyruvate ferredoxin oxidoreductase family protein [Streptomyces justiciae]MBE8476470.1 indolepyruvate ferredoxin oxidoreductase family protein [Streptomyces justiciae]